MREGRITEEIYTTFITTQKEMLYRIAFGYLHDEVRSLDAVDEAVYLGYVRRDQLREPSFLKTWVVRILINECLGMIRRGKREVITDILPEDPRGSPTDTMYLKLAIDDLEEHLKKVIILRYFGGFTIAETAEILGIPDGTVSTRSRKALELLRVDLEQ